MNIGDQILFLKELRLGRKFDDVTFQKGISYVLGTLVTAQPKEPSAEWMSGNPPKRGVYRVKCDGPNPNIGYRYWHGDHWGILYASYSWALQTRNKSRRKARIVRPVLYQMKAKV